MVEFSSDGIYFGVPRCGTRGALRAALGALMRTVSTGPAPPRWAMLGRGGGARHRQPGERRKPGARSGVSVGQRPGLGARPGQRSVRAAPRLAQPPAPGATAAAGLPLLGGGGTDRGHASHSHPSPVHTAAGIEIPREGSGEKPRTGSASRLNRAGSGEGTERDKHCGASPRAGKARPSRPAAPSKTNSHIPLAVR